MQKNTGNNNKANVVCRCWYDLLKGHFKPETMREIKLSNNFTI